ncbi:gamma-thionin [Artemisia annua]|uniref:Gamma-thionin n=1 Tax=Artemisia annua TaxID=35608 RepID=A0A2U1NZL2_ARTAN|nr:gamma-thionin [Artemisia annua]
MEKNTKANAYLYVLLFLSFIHIQSDMISATKETQNICTRLTKSWSGPCEDSSLCAKLCHDHEGALGGACHPQEYGNSCFCNYYC